MTAYTPGELEQLLSARPPGRRASRFVTSLACPRDRDQVFVGRGPGCDCRIVSFGGASYRVAG